MNRSARSVRVANRVVQVWLIPPERRDRDALGGERLHRLRIGGHPLHHPGVGQERRDGQGGEERLVIERLELHVWLGVGTDRDALPLLLHLRHHPGPARASSACR